MNQHPPDIVLLSYEYPPVPGGISNFCRDIVRALNGSHGQVEVLTSVIKGEKAPRGTGISAVPFQRPWRELVSFWRLRTKAKVLLASIWYPEGLIACLRGARPIILAHGLELFPYTSPWRKVFWSPLRKWVFKRASLILANSHYSAGLVRRIVPHAQVEVLNLGVDTQRFFPLSEHERSHRRTAQGLEGKLVLSTVARLVHYKGFSTVFEALSLLSESERERCLYRIAGTGPDADALREQARRWGVDHLVEWRGWIADKDLPAFYQTSDLFLLCSRENQKEQVVEGFGIVYLEAQACGVPVIGTRTGGISDAVEEGNGGWLIDAEDAGRLAKKLSLFLKEPELLRAEGAKARARVQEEFSFDFFRNEVRRFAGVL